MHRSFFRSNEPAGSLRLSNHTNAEHYRTAVPSQRMDCSAPIETGLVSFQLHNDTLPYTSEIKPGVSNRSPTNQSSTNRVRRRMVSMGFCIEAKQPTYRGGQANPT